MNKIYWKEALTNTPETTVKVSTELHQNIMRAVKLASPADRKRGLRRAVPAWGLAVFAIILSVMIFYPSLTTTVSPVSAPDQVLSEHQSPVTPLEQLADGLLMFSREAPVPEQELRKELERLKTDLERFDFRS